MENKELMSEFKTLKADLNDVKKNVAESMSTMSSLERALYKDMSEIKTEIGTITKEMSKVKSEVGDVKTEQRKITEFMVGDDDGYVGDGFVSEHKEMFVIHKAIKSERLYEKIRDIVESWGHIKWLTRVIGAASAILVVLEVMEQLRRLGIT